LTIVVVIAPLLYSLRLSVWRYNLTDPLNRHYVGLSNYETAIQQPVFWSSLRVTLIYTVASVFIQFFMGFGFALLVNHLTWGKRFTRTAIMLPAFITPVVVALTWRFLLHPELGAVNYYLQEWGIIGSGLVWLGDKDLALPSVIMVDAGLQAVPQELLESASIDGANAFQKLRHIIVPLLKPLILVGLIIRSMDAMREFDTIFVLTGGGPGTLTEVISLTAYRFAFRNFEIGIAAAISFIIFLLVLLFSILFVREMQRARID
jgi:multiple sugar transport system permease protein